jgi:tetratricopeptide (TPR) repeat protein
VATHPRPLIASLNRRFVALAGSCCSSGWAPAAWAWCTRPSTRSSSARWRSSRVEVEHARGGLRLAAGDAQEAVAALTRALERAEVLWGKDDPRLVPLLRDRAVAHGRLQQVRPAVADAERALALGLAAWGPAYPDLARTRRTLGLLYVEQLGDVARGERELTLARELYRAQLGPDWESAHRLSCRTRLTNSRTATRRRTYARDVGRPRARR